VIPDIVIAWKLEGKDYRIGTLRYDWPISAYASQAFSTDSEDFPLQGTKFEAETNA